MSSSKIAVFINSTHDSNKQLLLQIDEKEHTRKSTLTMHLIENFIKNNNVAMEEQQPDGDVTLYIDGQPHRLKRDEIVVSTILKLFKIPDPAELITVNLGNGQLHIPRGDFTGDLEQARAAIQRVIDSDRDFQLLELGPKRVIFKLNDVENNLILSKLTVQKMVDICYIPEYAESNSQSNNEAKPNKVHDIIEKHRDEIENMIRTLTNEKNSFWSMNKDRKDVKIQALEALLKPEEQNRFAADATPENFVKQILTVYKSADLGFFSNRTGEFLKKIAKETLEQDTPKDPQVPPLS
ncbi:hypothetical protein ACFORL_06245 [Legionella dresdenensis]|uniref:Dot/Icm T4SS effector n=1 Tax=Legionella dresdenensis TaxID=450200 RepID=A0ABV8CEN5_9GAMM